MKRNLSTVSASLLIVGFAIVSGRADDFAEKGRDIFNQHRHAVVTVQVVQKVNSPGQAAREGKQDLTGTVIDPSGLTVLALSSCDPAELWRRLSPEYNKSDVEITDMKILLDDGTELPAEIVLRDKDLDLAFIRPKTKPTTPLAAIDLSQSGSVDVLDQVVALNRLKQAAGRAFSASVERISAVVRKPRTFYIPDSGQSETGVGSPAFSLNGKITGVFVMRAVNAQGVGNYRDCLSVIILPAEDIAKAAAQAPEVKPDDAKPDAAKDSVSTAKDTNSPAAKTTDK